MAVTELTATTSLPLQLHFEPRVTQLMTVISLAQGCSFLALRMDGTVSELATELYHLWMNECEDTYAVWGRLLAHDCWLRTLSSIWKDRGCKREKPNSKVTTIKGQLHE